MRVLVWDWPVRVFHWLLVASFAGAWFTSGDDRYTHIHVFLGYAAVLLVLFRVAWGFAGTRHALFRAFFATPTEALAYLKDLRAYRASRWITHNPVGSWAVWLLLSLALVLAVTGLLVLGGEEQQGPLAGLLDRATGDTWREIHEFIAWTGVVLIAVHVLGVIVEGRIHRENLVRGMLDGRKDGAPGDAIPSSRALVAVVLCVALAGFGGWYFRGHLNETAAKPYLPYVSAALPASTQWNEECGSCHLAYHPSLLPARSWQAMFAGEADHFGDDLMLDADVVAALTVFTLAHSAEKSESEAAVKTAMTTPVNAAPLRITETPYWKRKHADIAAADWKTKTVHGKGDCGACHYDAEQATFEDGAMRIPPR